MPRRIDPDVFVEIDNAQYVHRGYLAGRHHLVHAITGENFVHEDANGVRGLIDDATWDDLLEAGRLVVKSRRPPNKAELLDWASEMTVAQACELDPGVARMFAEIDLLDRNGVANGPKAIERFLHRNWKGELVEQFGPHDSVRNIREWRATRGRAGNRHPRELVRHRGSSKRRNWTEVEAEIQWKHALASKTADGSVKASHSLYVAELESVNAGTHPVYAKPDSPYVACSERTFRRRCEDLEQTATVLSSRGEGAVEQDWKGSGRPLRADHLLHRVIVDHTPMDVHVVDDERGMTFGRPTLTLAVDVRTRAVVAWVISFIPPGAWTVGEILRRMGLPKRPPPARLKAHPVLRSIRGRPTELHLDNASEFRGFAIEAAARGIGFSIVWSPVRKPRYRAIVERAIQTLNATLCRELPGKVIPIAEARRLGYDAESEAVITLRELEAIVNDAIADYHVSGHDGLKKRQPAAVWAEEAARTGVLEMRNVRAFRIETMEIEQGVQLDAGGITRWGLRYSHPFNVPALLDELVSAEPRRRRRDDATATVDFRYDPNDISRIYVWNRISRTFVELVCDEEDYATGMPLAFHRQLQKAAEKQAVDFCDPKTRVAFRSKRIAFIKSIRADAPASDRDVVARLAEIARIRQITGQLVDLQIRLPEVAIDEFIASDVASLTSLDHEILAPRGEAGVRRDADDRDEGRDARDGARRNAAEPSQDYETAERHERSRPGGATQGGWN